MKTVVMAGGKGTRINSLFPDIPKPLIPFESPSGEIKPVLEWEILSLASQGFKDFVFTVSYMHEEIEQYFGNGEKWGVNIEYFVEDEPLGNAGALLQMDFEEDFLLINADTVFDIDFSRMISFHKDNHALVTILTHPNSHPYDSGLIVTNEKHEIVEWLSKEDKRPPFYKNCVNAGIHIISPKILGSVASNDLQKIDLDRMILKPLCGTNSMFAYCSTEYVKDIGTPERYNQVQNDFKRGIVAEKNLKNKQKAIFLDRDGTINKYIGFITDIDDFDLLPTASEAVKAINESGYLAIVCTNQPVIARGEVSVSELENIHKKMETELGKNGAYLDDIYYCPHHPHSGYEGEVVDLKIDCDCRKPKPGMLYRASKDYNINLRESWMIGDSEIDVLAGKNAGCKTAAIGLNNADSDIVFDNLLEAVKFIIDNQK